MAYRREQARRRARAGERAPDGPTSQPLSPEQEAQREAEHQLLQQQKAQEHQATGAAQSRLDEALEAQYGHKPELRDLLKGSYWRQQLRASFQHPARELTKPIRQTDHALKQMLETALRQNARHAREITEQAGERGIPMTPVGASVAAGVSDTLEEINAEVAACKEDLVRAMEAESRTEPLARRPLRGGRCRRWHVDGA
jgi:hypothetical protein